MLNDFNFFFQLDLWLRRRTIESLSTAALTLTSLLSTVKRVPTMVINSYVAGRVQHAVEAWMEAVGELASPPSTKSTNAGVKAFAAAQIALEDADAAFFDHSLLDLLYFPVSSARLFFKFYLIRLNFYHFIVVGSSLRHLCSAIRAHWPTITSFWNRCIKVFLQKEHPNCRK